MTQVYAYGLMRRDYVSKMDAPDMPWAVAYSDEFCDYVVWYSTTTPGHVRMFFESLFSSKIAVCVPFDRVFETSGMLPMDVYEKLMELVGQEKINEARPTVY